MKTDALIDMLARGPVGADTALTARRLAVATGAGLALVAAAMLVGLGLRPDLEAATTLPMFWLKLAFPAVVATAAFVATSRLARPGDRAGVAAVVLAALTLGLWTAAALAVANVPPEQRTDIVVGSSALACMASIAALSLPLLAALFIALRSLAPTRLGAAGAAAGALAGAAAAAVYALHCTEMTLPFLAIWYVLGMALPAIAGALLGPRFLRWR